MKKYIRPLYAPSGNWKVGAAAKEAGMVFMPLPLNVQYSSLSEYLPFVRLRNLITIGPVAAGMLVLSQKPAGNPPATVSSPVQATPPSPRTIVPPSGPEPVPEEVLPPEAVPVLAPPAPEWPPPPASGTVPVEAVEADGWLLEHPNGTSAAQV